MGQQFLIGRGWGRSTALCPGGGVNSSWSGMNGSTGLGLGGGGWQVNSSSSRRQSTVPGLVGGGGGEDGSITLGLGEGVGQQFLVRGGQINSSWSRGAAGEQFLVQGRSGSTVPGRGEEWVRSKMDRQPLPPPPPQQKWQTPVKILFSLVLCTWSVIKLNQIYNETLLHLCRPIWHSYNKLRKELNNLIRT